MSSIKCVYCGLVNFSDAGLCQRCRQALPDRASAFAGGQSGQTKTTDSHAYLTRRGYGDRAQSYQPYQFPPPPPSFQPGHRSGSYRTASMAPSCVKCGGRKDVFVQHFKKDYIPPVCFLGALFGLLPAAILVAVLKTTHQITAPFCDDCWQKFRKVGTVETLTTLGFLGGFFLAVAAALVFESGWVFLLLLAGLVGLVVWGQMYKKKNSPKYTRVNKKEVVIDAPIIGEISFVR